MKAYAKGFYTSQAWKSTRAAYSQYRRGLCESCLAAGRYVPGEIVHHKRHVTPETINDPAVLLDFDNLMLVCRECHAREHGARQRRYRVDDYGHVTPTETA